MFTSQHSAHQFSPQRRQILGGANKRLSPKKAFLGNDEAVSVGPQKLFADLKQQSSAQKASTSSSVFGAKSKPFGEKTNRSPLRAPFSNQNAGDVPVKPRRLGTSVKSVEKGSKQLVSPSKVEKNADEIFLASTSPSKRKKKGKEENQEQSSRPTEQKTPSSMHKLKDNSGLDFVTPAANIGTAGAMRQRIGEMLDAAVEGEMSLLEGDVSAQRDVQGLTEEELYPEIEFMPPHVEVPYDFPPELDGMPRGKEMGELLSRPPRLGFYKATRPASVELQRQETLADVPAKIDLPSDEAKVELPYADNIAQEFWPDVEVGERSAKEQKPPAALHTHKVQSMARERARDRTSSASTARVGGARAPTRPVTKEMSGSVGRSVPTSQGRSNRSMPTVKSSTIASRSALGKHVATTIPTKTKKALGEKDSNASVRRTMINPALTDFENDKMGKSIQAKLQACENDAHFEGFIL